MYILFLDFKFFPAKKFLLKDNAHITFFFRGIDRLLYVPSPSSIYIYPHTHTNVQQQLELSESLYRPASGEFQV